MEVSVYFSDVTFKEWSAWIMLGGCLLVGLFYFGLLFSYKNETGAWMPPIVPFIVGTVILITVSIIGHMAAAISNPNSAMEPYDERDKIIRLKAGHLSGVVLGFGVIISLLSNSVSPDGNLLFHMVFASLLIAQMTEYVLNIFGYRWIYSSGKVA